MTGWESASDEKLRHWRQFHVARIAKETVRAEGYRSDPNDLITDELRAGRVEQCELSIYHSRRALEKLSAEADRRDVQLEMP